MPKKASPAPKVAGHFPAKGKLLANLSIVTPEDRARAGITDADATREVEAQQPKATGVTVVRGPWQAHADVDVEEQIRVVDHDTNRVLFAGNAADFQKLTRAIQKEG